MNILCFMAMSFLLCGRSTNFNSVIGLERESGWIHDDTSHQPGMASTIPGGYTKFKELMG